MNARKLFMIMTLLLTLLASCEQRPKGVLSEKKMVKLLADMQIAEAYVTTQNPGMINDSLRYIYSNSVLESNHVSRAELDSTMKWYARNMDLYQQLYVEVERELTRRQSKITGVNEAIAAGSDMWPYGRNVMLMRNGSADVYTFSLEGGEGQPGEVLHWRARLPLSTSVKALLGVDYEGGMSSFVSRSISYDKEVKLELQTDTSKRVRRVYGMVSVAGVNSLPVWLDSITLYTTPFDSTEYYKIGIPKKYYGPHRIKRESAEESSIDGNPSGMSQMPDAESAPRERMEPQREIF